MKIQATNLFCHPGDYDLVLDTRQEKPGLHHDDVYLKGLYLFVAGEMPLPSYMKPFWVKKINGFLPPRYWMLQRYRRE